MSGLPASAIMTIVRGLLEFPYPQICRHLVAAELLAALDENGHPIEPGLIKATWEADDITALSFMEHSFPRAAQLNILPESE